MPRKREEERNQKTMHTMNEPMTVRFATEEDAPVVYRFIRKMAEYEKPRTRSRYVRRGVAPFGVPGTAGRGDSGRGGRPAGRVRSLFSQFFHVSRSEGTLPGGYFRRQGVPGKGVRQNVVPALGRIGRPEEVSPDGVGGVELERSCDCVLRVARSGSDGAMEYFPADRGAYTGIIR